MLLAINLIFLMFRSHLDGLLDVLVVLFLFRKMIRIFKKGTNASISSLR